VLLHQVSCSTWIGNRVRSNLLVVSNDDVLTEQHCYIQLVKVDFETAVYQLKIKGEKALEIKDMTNLWFRNDKHIRYRRHPF